MAQNQNKYKNAKKSSNGNSDIKLRRNNISHPSYYGMPNEVEEPNIADEEINEEASNPKGPVIPSIPSLPKIPKANNNLGKAVKAKVKGLNFLSFFNKYRIIIVIAIMIAVIFGLLVLTASGMFEEGSSGSGSSSGKPGLNGYAHYEPDNFCKTVTVYNHDKTIYTRELDFETEYLPGVLYAEVRGFADSPEVLKLFAIAARSYALKAINSDCTIEGSPYVQAFEFDETTLASVTADTHPIKKSVMDTYGLVAVKNNELMKFYYDAACYRGEDATNYHIGYGSLTLGSEQIQKIPKSWDNSGILYYINKSKENNRECYQGHGYGISQYGAYYLATQENKTMQDLLKYYAGDVKLYSIYQGVGNNYTMVTSAGTDGILTMALGDFLESKGTSATEYNEYMLQNIINAGVGTREAVIQTAVSLVGNLYQQYGVRLPYALCGQHYCSDMYNSNNVNVNRHGTSFYGVDPAWGSEIHNKADGTYKYWYNGAWAVYTRYGPDCSGFISWLLHNAGFSTTVLGADAQGRLGTQSALNGTQVGEPGDLMWTDGHIMVIVGVDTSTKQYYIAHASGGSQGVKINTIPFKQSGYYAVDMDDWYSKNKRNISNEDFMAEYRAGYVS